MKRARNAEGRGGIETDEIATQMVFQMSVILMMAQAPTGTETASQTNAKLTVTPMAIQMITTSRWVGQKM